MKSIYRSDAGRQEILANYDRRLAHLALPVDSMFVATRFGSTHVLTAGPSGAPPLLLLHGTNGSGLDLAEALGTLAAGNRCVFIDVPGHPNRSTEARLSKADGSYARWMEDVLAELKLGQAAMLGVSGGGFIALKCAALCPERLTRLVLIAPQGLSRPRPLALFRAVLWPLFAYNMRPSVGSARRFVRALSRPELPSELAVLRMALIMQHVDTEFDRPGLFNGAELARLAAPVMLIAGGRDALFPGDRVVRRARKVIPHLSETILLPEANHLSAELFAPRVTQRIAAFLAVR